ncbi:PREDICTED: ubiquitin carboxyl-terminal hydrolase 15-like [Tarenaya hassleriana]|uniref:ubiquitin carboxyl-terminal hydrolase 15-like n=1 Tax=Tarenaya hassleriana TaxID=28532 RepID=UPI00053C9DEC|nr:PREDICTED: ubiquitin carboxyl-terminal hydrolase 15-like [Tarenaya hassleriana]
MLEPKEADIPILFLVLVVLPVVAYILLGKWSEASERRGKLNVLAQMAAEEALKSETVAVPSGAPVVFPSKNNGLHACARCFSPATTRCSRCKSVRYCSGKCQIIHWRQAHKDECVPVETCSASSEKVVPKEDSVLHAYGMDSSSYSYGGKQAVRGKTALELDNGVHPPKNTVEFSSLGGPQGGNGSQVFMQERSAEKRNSGKPTRGSSRTNKGLVLDSSEEASWGETSFLGCGDDNNTLKKVHNKHKMKNNNSFLVEENSTRHAASSSCTRMNEQSFARCSVQENVKQHNSDHNRAEARSSFGCSSTQCHAKGARTAKLPKSGVKKSGGEHPCTETSKKGTMAEESKTSKDKDIGAAEENNDISTMGIMKMMGLRKSTKLTRHNTAEQYDDRHKKLKMLFPYEEFVKFFQSDVFDLSPRGLVNCGNSCYANAVLQSLTCTKPLVAFLLRRLHSRTCCRKDWCLMCELEQHVMMLREIGGPLSASRILSHMRSINCQIGDGSQEDAHEFLRLLVASMQSICLERLGGESKVDPRSQETTFVQHTFGGRLRSKVKCLRCHHESERYESIMDLTLEIYGWVESLQDAFTQFTTPEDLDGENMYRCSRCAEYVRARKQLSIHEAPNILTIVLKRFQEGRYGKINKCITFPEMLDMTPFMTGTGDIPPLYMLYAVVVHLDTLNASFSGHYISYVKDLRGNWFRIDDSEIHPVPMSQVMSEGAYMLFYMRSHPRPQRTEHSRKTQVRHCQTRNQTQEGKKPNNHFVGTSDRNQLRPRPDLGEFSDDWSLFTSSDEASFTTESTRDSFSTIDYTEACNPDSPFSIFNNLYPMEMSPHNTVACRMFSGTKPETRFFPEEKSYSNTVMDSSGDYYSSMYVNYGPNLGYDGSFSVDGRENLNSDSPDIFVV